VDYLLWGADPEYPLDEPWPSNPEMTRLFDEDQGARQAANIDWDVVGAQDAARRVRTHALLDAGALHSAGDFWHAAFVFQHGDKPQDYLLAHGLAIIAAAKGRRDAAWIAAASLDRYLQAIGQKQVYGTQYHMRPGTPDDAGALRSQRHFRCDASGDRCSASSRTGKAARAI
jgi:hypothetical protein